MSGRPRAFDWDAARADHAAGMTYPALAAKYGVSKNAIERAVNPAYRERQYAAIRNWIDRQKAPCVGGCGAVVWGHMSRATGYCQSCAGELRRTAEHGTESKYNQGCKCDECRAACAKARRERRHRAAERGALSGGKS